MVSHGSLILETLLRRQRFKMVTGCCHHQRVTNAGQTLAQTNTDIVTIWDGSSVCRVSCDFPPKHQNTPSGVRTPIHSQKGKRSHLFVHSFMMCSVISDPVCVDQPGCHVWKSFYNLGRADSYRSVDKRREEQEIGYLDGSQSYLPWSVHYTNDMKTYSQTSGKCFPNLCTRAPTINVEAFWWTNKT